MEDHVASRSAGGSAPPPSLRDLAAAALVALGEPRGAGHSRCARRHAGQDLPPPEGLALSSKFSLSKDEDLLVLGTRITASKSQAPKMQADNETTAAADQLVGRNDETVAVAANNDAGDGSDRKVADKIDEGLDTEPKAAAGEAGKKKKKKSAKKPIPPAAGDQSAAAAAYDEQWSQFQAVLESTQAANNIAQDQQFKTLLLGAMGTPTAGHRHGPICANPNCRKFGHTLAVCPIPTNLADGDMSGCFFCNVVEHDADDCPMMEWALAQTLVTYLIHNRSGMPPWKTRIDWVKLALGNWDIVCFALLPLTRAYVKKEYIPLKRWEEVKGLSGLTDPLFKNADRRLLKRLANPDPEQTHRRPLMEAARNLCYCRDKCGSEVLFKNEYIAKYLADMTVDPETHRQVLADRAAEIAANERLISKNVPKKSAGEKKKLGRRALKKKAMAAADSSTTSADNNEAEGSNKGKTAPVAGPSEPKIPTADNKVEDADEENDTPFSERLLNLSDQIDDLLDNIRNIVAS